jgi:hypothetical protein
MRYYPLSRAAIKGRPGAFGEVCHSAAISSLSCTSARGFSCETLSLGRMQPFDARICGVQGEPDGFQRSPSEPCRLRMFFHYPPLGADVRRLSGLQLSVCSAVPTKRDWSAKAAVW